MKRPDDRQPICLGACAEGGVALGFAHRDAVLGTIGSQQRLEYTAIGDTVNLASRLEGLTKDFLSLIVVSQRTYEEVKHLSTRATWAR